MDSKERLDHLKEIHDLFQLKAAMWADDQISVGDFTYGQPIVHKWDNKTKLTIGKFCSIGAGVNILLGGEHHTDFATTYPFDVLLGEADTGSKGDVVIGNDVWIGNFVTILSGVTIGDGAVIGAGTVVASDVQPYSVVIGNPARMKRWRFGRPWIIDLMNLRWWDWPLEKIAEAYPFLMAKDIDRLIHFSGGWDDYE